MSHDLPFVSVLVPVRNEERSLEECVQRLLKSSYPPSRIEVLVCDGMSTDGTRAIVARMAAESNGVLVRLVDNPKGQRASGLNAGIRSARGEVILRVDARTRIEPDYIARCVKTLLRTGADNVGGVWRPMASTPMQEAVGLAMTHPFGVGDSAHRLGRSGEVDSVYPGCFRREAFERVGVFDEDAPVMSEDSDINQRIRNAGGRVYLDATIEVGQEPRGDLPSLWHLYFRYGGARAGFVLKHRRLTSLRQLAAPAFVAAAAGLGAASLVSGWARWGLLLLVGAYTAVTLGVSAAIVARRRRLDLLPRIAACFPCMHIAWGLGFWRRMIQRPRPGTYWPH